MKALRRSSGKEKEFFFTYKIGSVKGTDLFLYIQIYITIGISKNPLCFRSNIEYSLYYSSSTGIIVHLQFILLLAFEKVPGEEAVSKSLATNSSFAPTITPSSSSCVFLTFPS